MTDREIRLGAQHRASPTMDKEREVIGDYDMVVLGAALAAPWRRSHRAAFQPRATAVVPPDPLFRLIAGTGSSRVTNFPVAGHISNTSHHDFKQEPAMLKPSIDYSCAQCGHLQTYRLVPGVAPDPAASLPPAEIPSIDLRCLRCDARQTYMLVPDSVHAASADHSIEQQHQSDQ